MTTHESTSLDLLIEIDVVLGAGFMSAFIQPSEHDRIDAMWGEYIDGGKTRDRIVEVDCLDGTPLKFLISDLRAIDRTTRESRRIVHERDLALKAEKREDGILDD